MGPKVVDKMTYTPQEFLGKYTTQVVDIMYPDIVQGGQMEDKKELEVEKKVTKKKAKKKVAKKATASKEAPKEKKLVKVLKNGVKVYKA